MKTNLLLVLLFICLGTANATERIIERPSFATWSGQSLEIDKIVLNDTETIFYIDAFYTPHHWIKIASKTFIRANGTEYFIQKANGIELDKETYMPESGTMSFQLIFPPLPADSKEIDFIEGYERGAFHIWGIRLDGKDPEIRDKNPKEKIIHTVNPTNKEAVVHIQLLGYNPEMDIEGNLSVGNILSERGENYNLEFTPEGIATLVVPLLHPTPAFFTLSPLYRNLYLAPGDELSLTINLLQKTRSESRYHKEKPSLGEIYQFSGTSADLHTTILKTERNHFTLYPQSRDEHTQMMKDISSMNPQEYKAYVEDRYNRNLKSLNETPEIVGIYKKLIIQDLQLQMIQMLLTGKLMIEQAYRMTNELTEDAEIPAEINHTFPDDYYTSIKELMPTGEIAFFSGSFRGLLQNLPHFVYIPGINEEKQNDLPSLTNMLGIDKGFIFDWIKVVSLANPINNMIPLTAAQLSEISKISPEIEKKLRERNQELQILLESGKKPSPYDLEKVNIEDIPRAELFAALTYPHRGKVVFIDFWATWCGPCIQAMKESEPVKEEFMDKDIVFLYLAGENSPKKTWEEMIPGIKGIHYRLTTDQWDYLYDILKIEGIPSYMILDKAGNPVYMQAGFMGAYKMRELLNTELDK